MALRYFTYFAELCSRTVIFPTAAANMVVRTCLVVIEAVVLAPKVQIAMVTNPMLPRMYPMTLGSFIRYKKSVTTMAPCMAARIDPMALYCLSTSEIFVAWLTLVDCSVSRQRAHLHN